MYIFTIIHENCTAGKWSMNLPIYALHSFNFSMIPSCMWWIYSWSRTCEINCPLVYTLTRSKLTRSCSLFRVILLTRTQWKSAVVLAYRNGCCTHLTQKIASFLHSYSLCWITESTGKTTASTYMCMLQHLRMRELYTLLRARANIVYVWSRELITYLRNYHGDTCIIL